MRKYIIEKNTMLIDFSSIKTLIIEFISKVTREDIAVYRGLDIGTILPFAKDDSRVKSVVVF